MRKVATPAREARVAGHDIVCTRTHDGLTVRLLTLIVEDHVGRVRPCGSHAGSSSLDAESSRNPSTSMLLLGLPTHDRSDNGPRR